ncbi:hypothetical protein KSS87_015978 [Heliosperma pusillum]|nr:hypothetical protein KSS87_015978 [Heliosperma pusillum]
MEPYRPLLDFSSPADGGGDDGGGGVGGNVNEWGGFSEGEDIMGLLLGEGNDHFALGGGIKLKLGEGGNDDSALGSGLSEGNNGGVVVGKDSNFGGMGGEEMVGQGQKRKRGRPKGSKSKKSLTKGGGENVKEVGLVGGGNGGEGFGCQGQIGNLNDGEGGNEGLVGGSNGEGIEIQGQIGNLGGGKNGKVDLIGGGIGGEGVGFQGQIGNLGCEIVKEVGLVDGGNGGEGVGLQGQIGNLGGGEGGVSVEGKGDGFQDVCKRVRQLFESDSEQDEGFEGKSGILVDGSEGKDEDLCRGGELAVVSEGGNEVVTVKKKIGRPKGSKNKPKVSCDVVSGVGLSHEGGVSCGRKGSKNKPEVSCGEVNGVGLSHEGGVSRGRKESKNKPKVSCDEVRCVGLSHEGGPSGGGEVEGEGVIVCALMVADYYNVDRKGSGTGNGVNRCLKKRRKGKEIGNGLVKEVETRNEFRDDLKERESGDSGEVCDKGFINGWELVVSPNESKIGVVSPNEAGEDTEKKNGRIKGLKKRKKKVVEGADDGEKLEEKVKKRGRPKGSKNKTKCDQVLSNGVSTDFGKVDDGANASGCALTVFDIDSEVGERDGSNKMSSKENGRFKGLKKRKKDVMEVAENGEGFGKEVKKRGRPKGFNNSKAMILAAVRGVELEKKVKRRGRPKGSKKVKCDGAREGALEQKSEATGSEMVQRGKNNLENRDSSTEKLVSEGGANETDTKLVNTVRAHSLRKRKKRGRPKGIKNKRVILVGGVLHKVVSSEAGKSRLIVEKDTGNFVAFPLESRRCQVEDTKKVHTTKVEKLRPRRKAANYQMGANDTPEEVNALKKEQASMCHQCQNCDKDKDDVVSCLHCKKKRYCYQCLEKWYPGKTVKEVQEACPFCCGNCNCRYCLQDSLVLEASCKGTNSKVKLERLLYLMWKINPLLRHIQEEQKIELEEEARILGKPIKEEDIRKSSLDVDDRVYCDNCSTSIVNLHRSCPNPVCSYDLCLSCCRELREGSIADGFEADSSCQRVKEDLLLHSTAAKDEILDVNKTRNAPESVVGKCLPSRFCWKTSVDGKIPCPPKAFGGCGPCGLHMLELRRIFEPDWVYNLIKSIDEVTTDYNLADNDTGLECHFCPKTLSLGVEGSSQETRKAASRDEMHDNFLYCPSAMDIDEVQIDHFQRHWKRGEPVIVRDVLKKASGLSWEPMVMFRAFRGAKKILKEETLDVKAIDCLDWCEVEIDIYNFFKGYVEGRLHSNGWPEILKLKDWPASNSFGVCMPRHNSEFIMMLPYSDYTHPEAGILNLTSKIPDGAPKPDLGPKTYIAYGHNEELGNGDSVTKLHCDISDAVNVLMHTTTVDVDSRKQKTMHKLKGENAAEVSSSSSPSCRTDALQKSNIGCNSAVDEELSCAGEADYANNQSCASEVPNFSGQQDSVFEQNSLDENKVYGGAVWDIFRREDVPKIVEYLRKHHQDFRHINNLPLKSVIHPIHDQTFYLSEKHKKQLKEEFGKDFFLLTIVAALYQQLHHTFQFCQISVVVVDVEPWTFEQHLGEAVFIPAGCPHQVRNRLSCIKVALDFVSPENVQQCIQLTEEFRLLPKNHRSKEDKLEVKKMAIYAASAALNEARELMTDPELGFTQLASAN